MTKRAVCWRLDEVTLTRLERGLSMVKAAMAAGYIEMLPRRANRTSIVEHAVRNYVQDLEHRYHDLVCGYAKKKLPGEALPGKEARRLT